MAEETIDLLGGFTKWVNEKPATRMAEIRIENGQIKTWVYDRELQAGQYVFTPDKIDIQRFEGIRKIS